MRGHIAHILATVLMVVSLGAAQRPTNSESVKTGSKAMPDKAARTKPYQIGTASWYGSYFQGRATASGEPYDMYDLTAAHPTLPLGSWVKVTNLRNKKSVVVRVTDRLHHKNKRVVDLSRAAASKLGYLRRGLARVKVEVLDKDAAPR